ncbi:MAG TPA: putative toxin-antitoxin system toxin component, PIN family [Candidatus Dormibacteraeota bacterium]|nr:putative toxin-antitoxin system toxin component, PIN family [Candidatus Dormibacteraeota bacterium]
MRVVLDTNVLVSALVFPGGNPELVYRLVLEERIELVTSRTLLAELGSVLATKFGWESARVEQAIGQLARVGIVVEPTTTVAEIVADDADNRVLEAAAAGNAATIVSGDRHLLALGEWQQIPIQTPADFVKGFANPI